MNTPLRLIFRGDDAGSARSANLALHEGITRGILCNVGVMVPGPAFEHAVELFADLPDHIGLGLHVTLSSEWSYPKWGPVLPAEQVPTLVDENGHFTTEPRTLHDRGFSVDEALAEIEAQLDLAMQRGLRIEYIDEHMAVSWIHPDLRAGIAALARRRGLVDAKGAPSLPASTTPSVDLTEDWLNRCKAAAEQGGAFVIVTHPMFDDEEARMYTRENMPPGELARQRNLDRLALIDPRVAEGLRGLGIERIRYSDLAKP